MVWGTDTLSHCNTPHANETSSVELLIELTLFELIFECVKTNIFVGWFGFYCIINHQVILLLIKCSLFSPKSSYASIRLTNCSFLLISLYIHVSQKLTQNVTSSEVRRPEAKQSSYLTHACVKQFVQ